MDVDGAAQDEMVSNAGGVHYIFGNEHFSLLGHGWARLCCQLSGGQHRAEQCRLLSLPTFDVAFDWTGHGCRKLDNQHKCPGYGRRLANCRELVQHSG
jgi:hypothetical protein